MSGHHLEPFISVDIGTDFVLSSRTDFASSAQTFYSRLRTAMVASRRKSRLQSVSADDRALAKFRLDYYDSFRQWLFDDIIDPGLEAALRPPSYRPLVALIHLQTYLAGFSDDVEGAANARVFTPERVNLLIGCQSCEFTEVRSRARSL